MKTRVDRAVTSRRLRFALVVLLSALLICLQREASLHALSHFVTKFSGDVPAVQAAAEPCAECALLAAGSNALTAGASTTHLGAPIDRFAAPAPPAPATARPSYYRSRAPPRLA